MQDAAARSAGRVSRRMDRRVLGRKVRVALLAYLLVFTVTALIAEAGLRLFWHPRYWVHCMNWLVGSGEDRAGRKWWPDTTYQAESNEFWVRFHTDARGYRARPELPRTAHPYRVAFVGDSFTEAKQVDDDQTFVSLLERGLAERAGGREVVCENYGIGGSGIFDYWHRITHDVLRPGEELPAAVVLCIYPSNDFLDFCPDDGFEPGGRPKPEYFREPTWTRHVITWLSLKSKLAYYVDYSLNMRGIGLRPMQHDAPPFWWNDPAVAAKAAGSPDIRQIRALLRAIEQECESSGVRLVMVIVGPILNYPRDGQSPLTQIFRAWGIRASIIDVAARANATPRPSRLVFRYDAHLNPVGHRFLADTALEPLSEALKLGGANAVIATGRPDDRRSDATVR
jgi:hypothetical protein